jgi:sugar-specific transcriptional regulator TrmB
MEIEEILSQLGFTEYESKVYKTLFFFVSATAREIARETGIPNTRVYAALEKLAKIGAISMIPGKPVQYRIIPPDVGLLSIVEERKKQTKKLEDEIKELGLQFKDKEPLSHKLLVFPGHEIARKIKLEEIKNSKIEILRMMRFGKIDEEIFSEMEKAILRKVEIKILGPLEKEREYIIKKYYEIGCKIRLIKISNQFLLKKLISDNKTLLLEVFGATKSETLLLKITDQPTVEIIKKEFDLLWKEAIPYSPNKVSKIF